MDRVRVGVVGVGFLGQHHARIYADLPGAQLVAVADEDASRAAAVAAKHGCVATDLRGLLGEVEAVSVVVPTLRHHEIARHCLEAKLHVLVEKPLAATVEEAQDLTALASARGLVLQVGHVERFNSALRAAFGSRRGGPAREAFQPPNLVECRRWAPFSARGADVDVVLDLMIHDLDIVLALAGAPVEDVQANGVRVLSATTDVAHARVVFQNGCVATFSASRLAPAKVREIHLYDADQFWVLDLLQQTAVVGRRSVGSPGSSPVVMESLRGDHQDALRLELEAFLESVSTGAEPLVSGREGTAALELAFAIMEEIARHSTTISRRESHETTPHYHR